MKNTSKVVKISLSLALMLFVFAMTPASSLFNILRPVSAAPLTSISVSPASNIINEMATYNFLFKTATTGTIKTIEINFPSSFNVANIRLIEREGIGSGTLSFSGSTIKYTVGGSDSIPAGTNIRLEMARIIAIEEGSFTVSIKTLNSQGGTIDGPTTSGPFIIKSITGNDISPGFMIRKTLKDDAAGNAHGWNPDNDIKFFSITDNDLDPTNTESDSYFVSIIPKGTNSGINVGAILCTVYDWISTAFNVRCNSAPEDLASLHYIITKLPPHVVTSSSSVPSSQSSSPFATSLFSPSIDRQDETSSEFP